MTFPTVTGSGIALVITAIATPLTVFLSWLEQHRAADRKEQKDEEDRRLAREAQLAALQELSAKQDQVHTLVNDRSTQQDKTIAALSTALSTGGVIPSMPAGDAAPGQVTQDGGVISVGKDKP